jgi:Ser/Thr protein kinase RdoA (MazF antagonist)
VNLQANIELDPYIVQQLVETYYGYKVKKIQKVRAVYQLETDQGIVGFKNARKMKDIRFIQAVIEHLFTHGFSKIPTLRKTLSGKLLLRYQGEVYVMEEWLQHVREVSSEQEDWLYPVGKSLATYHQAVDSFPENRIPKERIRAPWNEWLVYQYRKIIRTEATETKDWLLRRMQLAYWQWEQQPRASFHLCHGSLHQENIMIDSNKEIWLIDYERLTYDEKGKDLAQLLMYHFRFHSWNSQAVEQLLGGYESVQSLKPADIHCLCARLLLPEKLVYAYQDGKDLMKNREQEEAKEQVLRKLFPSYWR